MYSSFTRTVKSISLHYGQFKKSFKCNLVTLYSVNEIDIHLWSMQKYAFCGIRDAKNFYYSFAMSYKRFVLHNGIEELLFVEHINYAKLFHI